MELLPTIDEEKELLILDRTYADRRSRIQFQIIYDKETLQFTLKSAFHYGNDVYPLIKQIVLNDEGTHLSFSTEYIICEKDMGRTRMLVGTNHLEVYNELVELYRNGLTHPLVDEWNLIGVFK